MWWELKMLSHFKLPIICSKGECIVLQSAWKRGEEEEQQRGQSLSAALGSIEVFIRQNNCRSLLAFSFSIMLFFSFSSVFFFFFFAFAFAKNTACSFTSLSSVIICHRDEKTIDNVKKEKTRDYRYVDTGLKRGTYWFLWERAMCWDGLFFSFMSPVLGRPG